MLLQLQRATPADLTEISSLVRQYFDFDGLDYSDKTQRAISELLGDPSLGSYYFVHSDTTLIGYCALTYSFDAEAGGRLGVVTDLFLLEEARGKGFGRLLVQELLSLAKAQGLHQLELYVLDHNDRARGLYESTGFQPVTGRSLRIIKL